MRHIFLQSISTKKDRICVKLSISRTCSSHIFSLRIFPVREHETGVLESLTSRERVSACTLVFHLQPQRFSVSIPHTSPLTALALGCMWIYVFHCRGASDEDWRPSCGHHSHTGGRQSIATGPHRLTLIFPMIIAIGIIRCSFFLCRSIMQTLCSVSTCLFFSFFLCDAQAGHRKL